MKHKSKNSFNVFCVREKQRRSTEWWKKTKEWAGKVEMYINPQIKGNNFNFIKKWSSLHAECVNGISACKSFAKWPINLLPLSISSHSFRAHKKDRKNDDDVHHQSCYAFSLRPLQTGIVNSLQSCYHRLNLSQSLLAFKLIILGGWLAKLCCKEVKLQLSI